MRAECNDFEVTASNIDKLATVEARFGGRKDRGIIAPMYDASREKLGGKPVSLAAAERMIEAIKPGDNVFLTCGMASMPIIPFGETDGPLGVASLARAVRFGLGALPILITNSREIESLCKTVKAAGLNIMDYDDCKKTKSAVAASLVFPNGTKDEDRRNAVSMMDEFTPKAVISIETAGPNKKGYKHFSPGLPFEASGKVPGIEHLFFEANDRGILTIGCLDNGNEIGSGTIEECVREFVIYGDMCQCECKGGMVCAVKADIAFPSAVSNWGAYAIVAVLGLLLNKPEILQDEDTERRMLEACIMAGAIDGVLGKPVLSVDALSCSTHQAYVTLLHTIIINALSSSVVSFAKK